MSNTVPDHATEPGGIDWDRLRAAAVAMTERSYAPYSQVRVGAAALTADRPVGTKGSPGPEWSGRAGR